jgi:hypothetical protein
LAPFIKQAGIDGVKFSIRFGIQERCFGIFFLSQQRHLVLKRQ